MYSLGNPSSGPIRWALLPTDHSGVHEADRIVT